MKKLENEILTDNNLTALAKSIYEEAKAMGFTSADYVKLVNLILNFTMLKKEDNSTDNIPKELNNTVKNELPIISKSLIIRKYDKQTDREVLKNWLTDEKSKLFLLSRTSANDLNIEELDNDENHLFGLVTLSNGTPIGLLALLNIDKKNKKAEMRKLIGHSQYRGRGFAKEATRLWIDYCLNNFGLNKIYINTLEINIQNISLNRHLGFKIEGVLKNECYIDGKHYDVFRMAYYK